MLFKRAGSHVMSAVGIPVLVSMKHTEHAGKCPESDRVEDWGKGIAVCPDPTEGASLSYLPVFLSFSLMHPLHHA